MKWLSNKLARLAADRDGMVALEFAILLPVLVIMLFGTVEIFLYYNAYANVARVAQTLSDVVTRQTTISKTTLGNFYAASSTIMAPTPTTGLVMTVASVIPPEVGPVVAWSCKGTPSGITGPGTDALMPGSAYTWPSTATATVSLSDGSHKTVSMLSYNSSVIVTDVTYTYQSPLGRILANPLGVEFKTYATPRLASAIPSPSPSC